MGLGLVLGSRGFDPEAGPAGQGKPVPGALRAAWTAGQPPEFSRGMNEPETHPVKKPNLEGLRAKARAWCAERAQKRAARPPVPSLTPGEAELYARTTAWLDRLSYLDDWSGC